MPYVGDLDNIPHGWFLCDGSNGTPDLRDRFITGAGLSYNLHDIGGENYHKLTKNELPSNGFSIPIARGDDPRENVTGANDGGPGSPSLFLPIKGGNDEPHENRPPYYAVYYIIRIN